MKGTVKWFDGKRGFGFIYSEELGGDIFVHVSAIVPNGDGIKLLSPERERHSVREGNEREASLFLGER